MKKRILVAVMSAALLGASLASCGKETTTVFEAESAVLKSAGANAELADVVDEGGTYVRLVSAWQPADKAYTLDFTFTANKAAEATITFKIAAPTVDQASGNMGSVLSEMYGVKVNGTAVDVASWDDTLGEPYDVTAEALNWVTVTYSTTLVAGQNDIQFYTIEKSGLYGDYEWHCTDSVCIDNVSVTTKATITA